MAKKVDKKSKIFYLEQRIGSLIAARLAEQKKIEKILKVTEELTKRIYQTQYKLDELIKE